MPGEFVEIEPRRRTAVELQQDEQHRAQPEPHQPPVSIGAEPVGEPPADRLRQPQNHQRPDKRGGPGDEQEA